MLFPITSTTIRENPQYIEVDTINLEQSLNDVDNKVDIIKEILRVWRLIFVESD